MAKTKENRAMGIVTKSPGMASLLEKAKSKHQQSDQTFSISENQDDEDRSIKQIEQPAISYGEISKYYQADIIKNLKPITENFSEWIGEIIPVPISLLKILDNVRPQVIRDDKFEALKTTIREKGLSQNLVVKLNQKDDGSEELTVVIGQRRLEALIELELPVAPCKIKVYKNKREEIEDGLIENIVREDLPPIVVGENYLKLLNTGATFEEISQKTGQHIKTIQRYINLTKWPPEAINILHQNPNVFKTHIVFNDKLLKQLISKPTLLISYLKDLVDEYNNTDSKSDQDGASFKKKRLSNPPDNDMAKWSTAITHSIKVPVTLSRSGNKYRMTVRWEGEKDFERLMETFGVKL